MYTIETGLFPIAGLLVGGALYIVERWVLRLKCTARWAQTFITVALLLTTLFSLTTLSRVVEVAVADVPAQSSVMGVPPPSMVSGAEVQALPEDMPDHVVTDERAVAAHDDNTILMTDASQLVGVIYIIGVLAVVVYLLCQLTALWLYRRRQQRSKSDGVYLTDMAEPFSFGQSIFLPRSLSGDVRRYVLLHEQAHLRHRHFLKLCLLQLLVAANWYNPFAWLLFSEMRLQQELEVDGDVLRSGIDRKRYQLALLSVCVGQPGRWILLHSTFHLQPLKQRIIFMNTEMNLQNMRRRQTIAAMLTVLVIAAEAVAGCQTHELQPETKHHPLRGCWTMDWISDTGSGIEVHPVAMHYGFYNDSTFLCFSYWSRKGINMRFSMSGEGYSWCGDTLVSADGRPTDYTLPDEQTVVSRWMKDSTQMAGVAGPDITEQWHRIKPCADIVTVFRAVSSAVPHSSRPMDGVWQMEDDGGQVQTYFLVNDTIFMRLNIHPSTVVEGFRYGASGHCGHLDAVSEYISQPDNNHLVLNNIRDKDTETYRRTAMPAYLLRVFSPALYEEQK